ncbi:MAG: hypothetical protein V4737_01605 [Curtobacterium sp.]
MVIWVTTTKEGLLAERAAIMERFGLDERGFEPIEAWRDLDVDEFRAKQQLLNIAWSMRNHERA